MTPYPDALPLDAINVIVTDIRNGAVAADRINFAKAVWVLEGYGLKVGFGDPAPVSGSQAAGPGPEVEAVLTDAEVLAHLEKITEPEFSFIDPPEGVAQGLPDILATLPWRAILKWALTTLAAVL